MVVEASYLRWEDNQPVTQEQLSIEIVSGGGSQPGAGGGGDGGGDLCTGGGMQRLAALECP